MKPHTATARFVLASAVTAVAAILGVLWFVGHGALDLLTDNARIERLDACRQIVETTRDNAQVRLDIAQGQLVLDLLAGDFDRFPGDGATYRRAVAELVTAQGELDQANREIAADPKAFAAARC